MLTFALAMILVGSLFLYAGWTGKSLRALLLGDSTVQGQTPAGQPRKQFGQGATS